MFYTRDCVSRVGNFSSCPLPDSDPKSSILISPLHKTIFQKLAFFFRSMHVKIQNEFCNDDFSAIFFILESKYGIHVYWAPLFSYDVTNSIPFFFLNTASFIMISYSRTVFLHGHRDNFWLFVHDILYCRVENSKLNCVWNSLF